MRLSYSTLFYLSTLGDRGAKRALKPAIEAMMALWPYTAPELYSDRTVDDLGIRFLYMKNDGLRYVLPDGSSFWA